MAQAFAMLVGITVGAFVLAIVVYILGFTIAGLAGIPAAMTEWWHVRHEAAVSGPRHTGRLALHH